MNIVKVFIRKSFWTINKWVTMPVPLSRYILGYVYDEQQFPLKKSNNVFSSIYDSNFWTSPESKSGLGSTLESTISIRKQLPLIIDKYSITSMLDIPCGDYNWMQTVPKNCNYIGGDIVLSIVENNQKLYSTDKVQFQQIDVTTDILPKVDLIFCKDCLQHLSNTKAKAALNNFLKSGSKYLLVTSYPKTWKNQDICDGDYHPLNLLKKPFYLPKPLLEIKEEAQLAGVEPDKTMYLYDLESLSLK